MSAGIATPAISYDFRCKVECVLGVLSEWSNFQQEFISVDFNFTTKEINAVIREDAEGKVSSTLLLYRSLRTDLEAEKLRFTFEQLDRKSRLANYTLTFHDVRIVEHVFGEFHYASNDAVTHKLCFAFSDFFRT